MSSRAATADYHHSTPLTSFLGREDELTELTNLLERPGVRLLTITGTGGVGKTSVAFQLATSLRPQWADGVHIISLASVSSPEMVLPTVSLRLGIDEPREGPTLDHLIERLAGARALLVLDNIEHLLAAGPDLAHLVAASPHMKLLITSREPLRVTGEHVFVLPPLPLPPMVDMPTYEEMAASPAVRLFVERARAVHVPFQLTQDNAWDVTRICRRLDGVPLAIELAAARIRVLSPHALLEQLADPLPLLTGGPRNAPARQQTMRDTIAWSYALLDTDEQRLFRRLAVFVGGFTLAAAGAVAHVDEAVSIPVLDGITSLVDKNLIVRADAALEPRYTMLETIREFALDALSESGEEEGARSAHADHFCALAEAAEPALRTAQQPRWIERLEGELPNLRSVLDWSLSEGNVETGLRVAGALYWFWFLRNHVREGRDWFERARASGNRPESAAGRAAAGAALLAWRAEDYAASKFYAEEALTLFDACNDHWGTAMIVHHLGHIADDLEHDSEQAIRLLSESLEQFAAIGDRWGVAYSQRCLAYMLALHRGDVVRAASILDAAATTFRDIGDRWNLGVTLHMIADHARTQQQWSIAVSSYQESLASHWEERDALGAADALLRLAQIQVALGCMETAAHLFGCAEAQHEQAGVSLRYTVRTGYEEAIDTARTAMGAERFDAAWQVGRALDLEDAVALALALDTDDTGRLPASSQAGTGTSLSRRERDVLRLLVDGRSDREIAEELSIGVRTVHTHVASILNKLGVSSRTAAATRAVRDGLV